MQNVEPILLLVLYILQKFVDVNKAINLDQLSLTKHENTKMKNPTHDTNTIVITSL